MPQLQWATKYLNKSVLTNVQQKKEREKKKKINKIKGKPYDNNDLMSLTACTEVHKSKRVGGLETGPEQVFVTDMFAWLPLAVELEREHTLESSIFVANGTGIAWSGGGSTVVFCTRGSLKVDGCTTGGVAECRVD